MSYTINVTNRTPITIDSGAIYDLDPANPNSLKLVGKNVPNYGQLIAQNFVNLIQNSASSNQPGSPIIGQLWYNSSNYSLGVYNGTSFDKLASIISTPVQPTSPASGLFWYDTLNKQLKVFDGAAFITIGPYIAGPSPITPETIVGTDNLLREVSRITVNGVNVAVFSPSTFTARSFYAGITNFNTGLQILNPGSISTPSLTATTVTATTLAGTLSSSAQNNITSVGTLSSLNVSGAVRGNSFTGISVYAGTIGNTGATLVGTLSPASQSSITAVGTLSSLNVTGTVQSSTFTGINVNAGTIGNSGSTLTGTLSTANQPYITTVGTLTSLTSQGNIVAAATTSSTNTTTGSLVVKGGMGVAGDIYCAGTIYATVSGSISVTRINNTIIGDITPSTGGFTTLSSTETLTVNGSSNPIAIANGGINGVGDIGSSSKRFGTVYASTVATTGNIVAAATTASTSTDTGSLVVKGGMGVAGDIYCSGTIYATVSGSISVTRINNTIIGDVTPATGGFTTLSSTGTLTVNINSNPVAIANGGTNGVGDIGTSSKKFATIYATASQANYADLAEYYTSDAEYEPGTVVMIGGDAEVTAANIVGTTKIVGVVSEKPAYLMNAECEGTRVAIALQGRVPCKVIGSIERGDLLIASDIPGVAISSVNCIAGSIIGKALKSYNSNEVGSIEIIVGKH